MSFTLYPDTIEPVEIGGAFAVLEGYLDVLDAIGSDGEAAFPHLIELLGMDAARVSDEWAGDLKREASALFAARSARLHASGAWLLRRLMETLPDGDEPITLADEPEITKGDVAEWHRLNDTLLVPAEKEFRARLGKLMASMYRAVVAAKKRGARSGVTGWKAKAKTFAPLYRKTMEAARADLVGNVTKAKRGLRTDVGSMVRDRIGRLADAIGGAHDRISKRLSRKQGWSSDELDDFLDDELEGLDGESFVDGLALTEAGASVSMGRLDGMAEVGAEMGKWITMRDKKVRDTHAHYGKSRARPIGFNYAKLTRGKYRLRWPYDEECDEAGEIVNCRCFLLPADVAAAMEGRRRRT